MLDKHLAKSILNPCSELALLTGRKTTLSEVAPFAAIQSIKSLHLGRDFSLKFCGAAPATMQLLCGAFEANLNILIVISVCD